MDTHEGTDFPSELRRMAEERIRSGARDDFGVIDRGIVIDQESKETHCIFDAPDAAAVVKHHEALQVPLEEGTIHRADVILP